ncbi:PQQ-dependent sugar dehydrogenase [Pararhodobacter sp. SW119]|uniref:PQQ-dependent sugar dehydrogenase n=1 Tax=Pararhodobacter sp. SW119 TaxID=2780075 RepID=UPI001ADFB60A|nr:PQQ-dependent sugar dehydrogenase [Pararhodobacter sp. SW119]
MRIVSSLAIGALALGFSAAAEAENGYAVEVLAEGLENPWALNILPGSSDLIMTGRRGKVMIYEAESGEIVEIAGAPEVDTRGQGGLLDIVPAPDFAETQLLYMTWSGATEGGRTTTHLGRARLDRAGGALSDLEVLHVVSPAMDSQAHYGSRIVFADGHVFVGLGDRNQKDFGPEHIAQDLSSENGSVIRLTLEGEIPADNPLVGQEGVAEAIWSYGHRNIQAMARNPETGEIWVAEHGEAGGDEINVVERGGNFGWPLAAFGVDYRTGEPFAQPHEPGDGFIAPVFHWAPGRSDHFPPSGMAWYEGEAFPEWRGHLLVGNLFHRYLGVFAVDGHEVSAPIRVLDGQGWRIRDVAVGPEDGYIYLIADDDSAPLLRLVPDNEED